MYLTGLTSQHIRYWVCGWDKRLTSGLGHQDDLTQWPFISLLFLIQLSFDDTTDVFSKAPRWWVAFTEDPQVLLCVPSGHKTSNTVICRLWNTVAIGVELRGFMLCVIQQSSVKGMAKCIDWESVLGLAGCAVCTEDINHAHIGFTCPLLPIASFAFAQLNCIVAKPHPSTMHDSPSLSPTSHPLSPMPTPPSLPYRRTAAIRAIAWHHSCQHLAVARCDGVIEIHHFGMQARTHTTLADHRQKNVTDMQWAWVAWVQIWIHTCDWWMKLTCNLYRCGLLFLMCRPHLHNILAVLSQEGLFVWSFDLESVRLAQLTWLSVPLLLA